ncbi:MAG TPA: MBL fold metallo-hydrolase [Kofleriaceae bacterium]|nr:MBL fold metallo-hydrolase [Kofleriaceae bacterium]
MTKSREGLARPAGAQECAPEGTIEAIYDEVRRATHEATPAVPFPTPAVACVLWRRRAAARTEIELFLVQRAFTHPFLGGFWGFPGGRVEASDRDLASACAREVREELAIVLTDDASAYVPAARFVTPVFSALRYDAQYFLVEAPAGAAPDHAASREHRAGLWIAPAAALERFARGEWLMPSPVVDTLAALAAGLDGAAGRLAAAEREEESRRMWWLAAGIAVCPVRTPTLPPATHTNTYVVGGLERGAGDVVVIDPASPYDDERAALDRELDALLAAGGRVRAILLTHHHLDHVSGAAHLAAAVGAPIWAHADTARLLAGRLEIHHMLADGDVIELDGSPRRRLRVLHTPGHAPGHLCFAEEETGFIAVGDMVASGSTILVDPQSEGDMRLYLESLDRLARAGARALLPAHGAPIADPAGKLEEYVRHRLWREERVAAALAERGRARARDLVPLAYADVAPALVGLAERSLVAHLFKLAADGRARREGDEWLAPA